MGPRAGLDGRKISSPPGFDPGPSTPYSVAIPTELPGPQDIVINAQNLHVKYPIFLPDFDENWNLLSSVSKNTQIPNFVKIRPVGAELSHEDRRTDMAKLIVAFSNFSSPPKKDIRNKRPKLSTS